MNLYRWTSLGRAYDLGLKHNRLILGFCLISALVVVATQFVTSATIRFNTLADGLTAGAVTFAAGVLSKELYPDHQPVAALAAALSLIGIWFTQPWSLPVLFWLIGALRLLNRSSGPAPKPTDILVLLAVTTWLIWRVSPLFGFYMAGMFILDDYLSGTRFKYRLLGLTVLVATVFYAFNENGLTLPPSINIGVVGLLMTITALFIPVILDSYHVKATADATGTLLAGRRVQAAQATALAIGLITASWLGREGIIPFIALWAAFLAAGSHHLFAGRLHGAGVTT